MKVKNKLNVIAIATLILLLICFLSFSYTAHWDTGHDTYQEGVYVDEWDYISFNGIDLIKYRPLSGIAFLLLSVLNVVLCISSLSSKKNAPDSKIHVVLPTIAGLQFLFFFAA